VKTPRTIMEGRSCTPQTWLYGADRAMPSGPDSVTIASTAGRSMASTRQRQSSGLQRLMPALLVEFIACGDVVGSPTNGVR
jgi:hypothetical protein